MNFEQARFNMIEQQIRPWEVLDQTVLDQIAEIPREEFVPQQFRKLAFSDTQIPLTHGQVMMSPKLEARMVQALRLRPDDTTLEIGTGSGYVTALLARMSKQVLSIEFYADFTQSAAEKLARLSISNVSLITADGIRGWERGFPYDAIAVTGSVPLFSDHFQRQLKLGGRLFLIVGQAPIMEACLITRLSENEWRSEPLFETDIPPLIGAPTPERFVF
ncbi:MAG: protein-L-isoaspartate O-methyltransferase family protein [Gammaproteobacteria bacterium]